MCIASDPYREPNTILLEFDESLINAATGSQNNNINFSSIRATPSKQESTSVKKYSSWSNFIRNLMLVFILPIIIFFLYQKFRVQREEMDVQIDGIQATMLRIHTLLDR